MNSNAIGNFRLQQENPLNSLKSLGWSRNSFLRMIDSFESVKEREKKRIYPLFHSLDDCSSQDWNRLKSPGFPYVDGRGPGLGSSSGSSPRLLAESWVRNGTAWT